LNAPFYRGLVRLNDLASLYEFIIKSVLSFVNKYPFRKQYSDIGTQEMYILIKHAPIKKAGKINASLNQSYLY